MEGRRPPLHVMTRALLYLSTRCHWQLYLEHVKKREPSGSSFGIYEPFERATLSSNSPSRASCATLAVCWVIKCSKVSYQN